MQDCKLSILRLLHLEIKDHYVEAHMLERKLVLPADTE